MLESSYEYLSEEVLKPMILAKQNDYLKDLIQTVEENTKEIKKKIYLQISKFKFLVFFKLFILIVEKLFKDIIKIKLIKK